MAPVEPTITSTLFSYSAELRSLSENIHQHPEEKFGERYAHDLLTAFLEKEAFKVQKDYKSLSGGTAFRAEYSSAEYDPSLHPTIAVSASTMPCQKSATLADTTS